MTAPAGAIAAWMATRPRPEFHVPVFGEETPEGVARVIAEFCSQTIGSPVESFDFYWVSHGAVAGVRLASGRRVACKFLPASYEALGVLEACRALQRRASRAGLPAPHPLDGPTTWRSAVVFVDDWLPAPPPLDGRDRIIRGGLARLLHAVVTALNPPAEDVAALGSSRHRLPALPPVSGHPDYDAIAAETHHDLRTALDTSDLVVGHFDWRTQNVHVTSGGTPIAIYDWDSLTLDVEERIVGAAAAMFSVVHGAPNSWIPAPQHAAAFVGDYERHRRAPFSPDQRSLIASAALYKLAVAAGAEHRWDATGERIDHRSARYALNTFGHGAYTAAITAV